MSGSGKDSGRDGGVAVALRLSGDGRVTEIDRGSGDLLAAECAVAAGRAFEEVFVTPAEAAVFGDTVRAVLADGRPRVRIAAAAVGRPEVRWVFCRCRRGTARAIGTPDREDRVTVFPGVKRRAEDALRESEARFRAVFENAGVGIAVANLEGRMLLTNPAMDAMLGYAAGELIGRSFAEFTHPDDLRPDMEQHVQVARGEKAGFRMEKRYIRKDGSLVHAALVVTSIRDDKGVPVYVIGMVHDLTERKRAEDDRFRMQKLESLGELAGGIAHDFNNILAAIIGSVGLARLEVEGDSPVAALLGDAENAAWQARGLTGQLLAFARGGAPVKAPTPMARLLTETVGFCLRGTDIRSTLTHPPDLWDVDGDRDQIAQVFNNLFINASQAQPAGGSLDVRARNLESDGRGDLPLPAGRYVQVDVTDNGPGVPAGLAPRIFDPYFTTKKGGTGLGLAVVHAVVVRHGGHVSVHSEGGKGATFQVTLPASPARATAEPPADQPTLPRGKRALVMDDDPAVRRSAALLLQRMGFLVITASNGEEAVRTYREAIASGCPFDVVIMDLTVVGGMGGLQALQEIREFAPSVNAIVSSGYSNDAVMSEHEAHGFNGVLVKPYRLIELKRVLADVLAKHG